MSRYFFLAVLAMAVFAQHAPDRAIGTWRFNAGASTYESGPAPRESTRQFLAAPKGVRFVHTGVSADGKPFRTEYTAGYDGRNSAVTGSGRYDTVSQKVTGASTVDLTFRLAGEVTVTARRTISPDGNRMTIVAEGANPDGKRFRNLLIYDRVQGR